MKAELRSLPRSLADLVAQHLVASGRLLDDDPELAYKHARTARRLAARLGGVREAVAITAYLAEHYDEALTEFRAVRRMTGNHEVLAMMADCERALGRPDKALALTRDKHVHDVSEATQIELLIVAAGARRDMKQLAAAIQTLEVPELTKRTRAEWLPRLRYAYADALEAAGRTEDALEWFHRAAGADADGSTGAAERAARLEGLEFTDLDEDDDYEDPTNEAALADELVDEPADEANLVDEAEPTDDLVDEAEPDDDSEPENDPAATTNEAEPVDEPGPVDEAELLDEAQSTDEPELADEPATTDEADLADEADLSDEAELVDEDDVPTDEAELPDEPALADEAESTDESELLDEVADTETPEKPEN